MNQAVQDILKKALLLERKGKAFYSKVASQATDPTVKQFFDMMAKEEDLHIAVLSEQFQKYSQTGTFAPVPTTGNSSEYSDSVLSKELKSKIAAASFESAAVDAAISMEDRAIVLYSKQAEIATNEDERKLYKWLASWEQEHYQWLVDLAKDIQESVWNDSSFWPY